MNEPTAWRVVADGEGRPTQRTCTHLGEIARVEPSTTEGCEDCLRSGGTWIHLRECLTCGHIGCCDSSPNRHARAHAGAESGHDLIRSFEPGEEWAWCYADKLQLVPSN